MAHFAQLNESNEVIQVVVVANEDIADGRFASGESEEKGISFLQDLLGADTKWVQTSYNNNFRGVYAGTGMTYDEDLDEFVPPLLPFFDPADAPYPSWVWVTESDWGPHWGPPIVYPGTLNEDGLAVEPFYDWDEDTTSWVEVE